MVSNRNPVIYVEVFRSDQPKDRRRKISQRHEPSAKVASRIFAVPGAETEKLEQDKNTSNVSVSTRPLFTREMGKVIGRLV
jgi:hypothetical protein